MIDHLWSAYNKQMRQDPVKVQPPVAMEDWSLLGPLECQAAGAGASADRVTTYKVAVWGGDAAGAPLVLVPGAVIRVESPSPTSVAAATRMTGANTASAAEPASGSPACAAGGSGGKAARTTAAAAKHGMALKGFFMVQSIFRERADNGREGLPYVQLRHMILGMETVLGDAASPTELFLLDESSPQPGPAGRGRSSNGFFLPSKGRRAEGPLELPLDGDAARMLTVLQAECTTRHCDHTHKEANAQADLALALCSQLQERAGLPPLYVYRHVYSPRQGAFRELQLKALQLGERLEQEPEAPPPPAVLAGGSGFVKDGVTYRVGDFLYVRAEAARACRSPLQGKDKRALGPRKPWTIMQLLAVVVPSAAAAPATPAPKSKRAATKAPRLMLQVKRFYRPEEKSADFAYRSDWWDLLAPTQGPAGGGAEVPAAAAEASGTDMTGDEAAPVPESSGSAATGSSIDGTSVNGLQLVPADEVYGKCAVVLRGDAPGRAAAYLSGLDVFEVVGSWDPSRPDEVQAPPASLQLPGAPAPAASAGAAGQQLAGPCAKEAETSKPADPSEGRRDSDGGPPAPAPFTPLRALDVFAGCGGLSEGLHQSGVATSDWAIELDEQAAAAYQLNHKAAAMLPVDCMTLLLSAMEKAGEGADCIADEACIQNAAALGPDLRAMLPTPGSVDFLVGGPPCQGFSMANRNKNTLDALGKNSLVIAYLSFCEFLRPRLFLLENVKGILSKASQGGEARAAGRARAARDANSINHYFRLALRSLLDMGYQVRFGVLSAIHFGVPQVRERTFILAALPGEPLPDWPAPLHAHNAAPPTLPMPGGRYCATAPLPGAPLRSVTVQDAIADLPPFDDSDPSCIERNWQCLRRYGSEPTSAFQRQMRRERGTAVGASGIVVRGADHEVSDHVASLSGRHLQIIRLIPAGQDCRALGPEHEHLLPISVRGKPGAVKRARYGRVAWDSCFNTATTRCRPEDRHTLHPEQDRVLSVRERARGQGFPDYLHLSGGLEARYRQVGNAVPPPLALALGTQLRKALEAQGRKAGHEDNPAASSEP